MPLTSWTHLPIIESHKSQIQESRKNGWVFAKWKNPPNAGHVRRHHKPTNELHSTSSNNIPVEQTRYSMSEKQENKQSGTSKQTSLTTATYLPIIESHKSQIQQSRKNGWVFAKWKNPPNAGHVRRHHEPTNKLHSTSSINIPVGQTRDNTSENQENKQSGTSK